MLIGAGLAALVSTCRVSLAADRAPELRGASDHDSTAGTTPLGPHQQVSPDRMQGPRWYGWQTLI